MREIIFRAAHYYHNDKFSHFTYWGRLNYKLEPVFDDSCFVAPSHTNKTYIKEDEQFTGLYDKNKNRIFEGDIIKIEPGWNGDYEYSEVIAVIEYLSDEGAYWERNINDKYGIVHQEFSYNKDVEVIGNIHQNKDLLNHEEQQTS